MNECDTGVKCDFIIGLCIQRFIQFNSNEFIYTTGLFVCYDPMFQTFVVVVVVVVVIHHHLDPKKSYFFSSSTTTMFDIFD